MKVHLLGAVMTTLLIAQSAHAAPFSDLVPRLQGVLQCERAAFPLTKKQTTDLNKFVGALKASGATARESGAGAEATIAYRLPQKVAVFGVPVDYIDDLQPPFVSIVFPVPATDLVKAIAASGERKLKLDATTGAFEQTPPYSSKVEGQGFAVEHGISVRALSKNRSAYICNFHSTDPDAGG